MLFVVAYSSFTSRIVCFIFVAREERRGEEGDQGRFISFRRKSISLKDIVECSDCFARREMVNVSPSADEEEMVINSLNESSFCNGSCADEML